MLTIIVTVLSILIITILYKENKQQKHDINNMSRYINRQDHIIKMLKEQVIKATNKNIDIDAMYEDWRKRHIANN